MKKETKIELPTTFSIDMQHRLVAYLKDNVDKLKSGLFSQRSVDDIITYLKTLSGAEAQLWEQVRREYPESVGKSDITVSNTKVSWTETHNFPKP